MNTDRLSIEKATEALGISRTTLYRWTKTGFIKSVKAGLNRVEYEQSEIDRILAGVPSEGGE